MIWLNIKELEKLLIDGKMSDRMAFDYLLTHLIFLTIANLSSNDDARWVVWVQLIASLVIVVWGAKKTFEINKQGDNRDYFKRFISISFVAGIRLVVLVFIVAFSIVIVTTIAEIAGAPVGLSSLQQEILTLGGSLTFLGIYFYMLLNSFKRINAEETRLSENSDFMA